MLHVYFINYIFTHKRFFIRNIRERKLDKLKCIIFVGGEGRGDGAGAKT